MKNINFFSIAKRKNFPLILDGAMGSLLQQNKIKIDKLLWMSIANLTHPEVVIKIHKAYIKAGADIITTNTFRTNPNAYNKAIIKISNKEFVKKSVELSKISIGDLQIIIAGSNAPAEDCYKIERTISKKELKLNHEKHIEYLMQSEVDFILNETQSHFDEIEIICKLCAKKEIPFVMSLFFTSDLKLLSGENIFDVINFILDFNPLAICFNCIYPIHFTKLNLSLNNLSYKKIFKDKINWGLYLNCGKGNYKDEKINCGIPPIQYAKTMKSFLRLKPSFVGACCGSNSNHIKELKKLFDGKISN